jgi:hypothetical protein
VDLRRVGCYTCEIGRVHARIGVLAALLASSSLARAEVPAAKVPGRLAANLDGLYATIGFLGAGVDVEGDWYSGAGGEISLVLVREHSIPGAFGLAGGGLSYAGRDGGRLWLEAETAVNRGLPFALGLGAGVTAEVDPVRRPRYGAQATLWAFVGPLPYVRVGWCEEIGTFVEVGLMVKVPIRIWH